MVEVWTCNVFAGCGTKLGFCGFVGPARSELYELKQKQSWLLAATWSRNLKKNGAIQRLIGLACAFDVKEGKEEAVLFLKGNMQFQCLFQTLWGKCPKKQH